MCSIPINVRCSTSKLFSTYHSLLLYFIPHCPFSIPMQRVWSTYLDSSGHGRERSSEPNLVRPNTRHDNFLFTHPLGTHSLFVLEDGGQFSVCLFYPSSQPLLTPLAVVPQAVCLLPRQPTPQLALRVIYSVAMTMPALATTTILPVTLLATTLVTL